MLTLLAIEQIKREIGTLEIAQRRGTLAPKGLLRLAGLKDELALDRENEELLCRWFSDPDTWAGVFENQDLCSLSIGHRVSIPFDASQWDAAKLGMRAPDTKHIIGWRYRLVAKCRDLQAAIDWLRRQEHPQARRHPCMTEHDTELSRNVP